MRKANCAVFVVLASERALDRSQFTALPQRELVMVMRIPEYAGRTQRHDPSTRRAIREVEGIAGRGAADTHVGQAGKA